MKKKYVLGFSFMLIGAIFLSINLGLIHTGFLSSIWQFWPLVLIILGLNVLLKDTKIPYLGNILGAGFLLAYLSVAILASIYLDDDKSWIIGPFTISGNGVESGTANWIWNNGDKETLSKSYELDSTAAYEASISFGAGNLNISSADDKLLTAEMTFPQNIEPQILIDRDKTTDISISQKSASKWFWFPSLSQTWNLDFATQIPASFDIDTGASTNNLDFSKISLDELDLDTGASTTTVKFGLYQEEINARFDMGAATLVIQVPSGMAVYMDYDAGLSTLDLPSEIKKQSSKIYKTLDYDDADHKLHIDLDTGVSAIKIEYYSPEGQQDPEKTIDFDRIKYGSHSPYPYQKNTPHIIVLNEIDNSTEPTPLIDLYESSLYDDNLVVLLLQGSKSTGGYRIKTEKVSLEDNTLTITAEILEPIRDDLVTQTETSPYDLISIDKSQFRQGTELTLILQDESGRELEQTSYRIK